MFSKVFANDTKFTVTDHQALSFVTEWSDTKVISAIRKKGIAAFVTPDVKTTTYLAKQYTDGRISGAIQVNSHSACCAFTKCTGRWYLFPFHRIELANVGLVEDDVIRYIKTLNDLKCGFKYKYFGKQGGGDRTDIWRRDTPNTTRISASRYDEKDEYYWIGVPAFPSTVSQNVPYIHWIYLRYLINASIGITGKMGDAPSASRLAYYNIPRVLMYLIDVLKLSPFKAFMYTMTACPWYYSYGVTYADYASNKDCTPDLGVSASQFKTLLHTRTADSSMNNMLAIINNNNKQQAFLDMKYKLNPRHDAVNAITLFHKDPAEFVKYMDSCYHPEELKVKEKTNGTKAFKAAKRKTPISK